MYEVFTKDCQECLACREKVRNQRPVDTFTIRQNFLIMLALFLSGFTLVLANANATLPALDLWVRVFSQGLGWTLTVGMPLSAVVWYGGWIRPQNKIGYATYPFLKKDGSMHRHLHDPREGGWVPDYISVLIQDRVGGWNRTSSIYSGKGVAMFESWDGENVTLRFTDAEVTTHHYGYVLQLLQKGEWFLYTIDAVNSTLPMVFREYQRLMVELYVLEQLTDYSDPLGHGRSEHGRFLNDRLNKVLDLTTWTKAHDKSIAEDAYDEALYIVAALSGRDQTIVS